MSHIGAAISRQPALVYARYNEANKGQQQVFDRLSDYITTTIPPGLTFRSFLLTGAAGCGKTWTIAQVTEAATQAGYAVTILATTNKAARLLRRQAAHVECEIAQKAFATATTVDRYLYRKRPVHITDLATGVEQRGLGIAADRPIARLRFAAAGSAVNDAALVIVDEVSMLSPRDAALLQERCPKLILVGDAHQLPPVGPPPWLEHQVPDAALTEIVRQAKGSGIAQLGQAIRLTGPGAADGALDHYAPEVIPLNPQERGALLRGGLSDIDMVLAHTNKTCGMMNLACVTARFPGWYPGDAPPVGSQLYAHESYAPMGHLLVPKASSLEVVEILEEITGDFSGWLLRLRNLTDGSEVDVPCLGATFEGLAYQKAARALGQIMTGMAEIGYGYALTVHKSQGSEWPTVLVIDDYAIARGTTPHSRWLYTAVTRAKSTLLLGRRQ